VWGGFSFEFCVLIVGKRRERGGEGAAGVDKGDVESHSGGWGLFFNQWIVQMCSDCVGKPMKSNMKIDD
jgi:hypothetical protein